LMTVGVGPSGDHFGWPLPGPFQPGGPTNIGEPFGTWPSAPMPVDAASTASATLPTWVTSILWGLACSATGIVTVSTPS
jgi:hypothetical protein